MKLIKYEPMACKEEGAIFSGSVTINVPSSPQRLAMIKGCQFDIKQNGNEVQANASLNNIDALIKMLELAKPHIKKIDLVKQGGAKYESFDDMLDDSDCDEICSEIASVVINGIKLPKKLNQQLDSKLTGSTKESSQQIQATI